MSTMPTNPVIDSLIEGAKHNLREHDMLQPTFFIVDGERVGVFPADFKDDEAKTKAAMVVKAMVKEVNADYVFFIAESWAAGCKTQGEWNANRLKYGPSLATWPTAKEIVMFRYETPTAIWGGMADILPGREMGPIEWSEHKREQEQGRFTGFFEQAEVVH